MFSEADFQRFYRYCLALCHDADEARDLLHEGLVKFLRVGSEERLKPERYFRQILRNTHIDRYRSKKREIHIDPFDETAVELNIESQLEQVMVNRDTLSRLLGKLSHEDRELLFLWAVEGFTAAEMALMLAKPRGTILSKLHRIKNRLSSLEKRSKKEGM